MAGFRQPRHRSGTLVGSAGNAKWAFWGIFALSLLIGIILYSGIGNVIALEAGLSYLGIGVQPPSPSWGNIIHDGGDQVAALWWISLFPGMAIVLTVMAFNALGDGLRDALDPRQLPGR